MLYYKELRYCMRCCLKKKITHSNPLFCIMFNLIHWLDNSKRIFVIKTGDSCKGCVFSDLFTSCVQLKNCRILMILTVTVVSLYKDIWKVVAYFSDFFTSHNSTTWLHERLCIYILFECARNIPHGKKLQGMITS